MKKSVALLLCVLMLSAVFAPVSALAEGNAWDGSVDVSWYDPDKTEFYISTPAQLAGLAALVNGMTDPTCPNIIGNADYIKSIRVDDRLLVGAGGGNVSDTVYSSAVDFAYKTVYLTADMDMGGKETGGNWSGPNWTPIGGKFPMKPEEVSGDCLTLDTRFNGVLDGQGHSITNLYCDRYAKKGFPYSMAIGVVGFLGGGTDGDTDTGVTGEFDGSWQPAVRNLILKSGSVLGRRMVGGVVGRVGQTSNGVIIENCANYAAVKSTDAKGVGGIVGSGWGDGVIRNCYNVGYITTTYSSPAGGIVGTNEGLDIYNCSNAGKIDTNGQSRGRGIGSHDTGVYTVNNCYYLAGCGDDSANPGYYKGLSQKISVTVTEVSDSELKSAEMLKKLNASGTVFAADEKNINGGYPVLWFQNGERNGVCKISVKQADGGSISLAGNSEVPFGQTVTLSCTAKPGYTLDYFTVNGKKLASDFFTATENAEVSAVFTKLLSVKVTIPTRTDCYVAVSRQGWKLNGSDLIWTDGELLRSGDTLVQGNILTVLTYGYTDISPEDMDREYINAYDCTLPGTVKNADGTYTVSATADVNISVTRKTQAKSWINLADTSWYLSGGRRSEYTINTPEELAGLAYLVNKGGHTFEGVTIRLGKDISLLNADGTVGVRNWTPIGSNVNRAFRGVFDGNGHAVYDMTVDSAGSYAALFGCCVGAAVKNLTVCGSVSGKASASYAAGIASYFSGGSMENCVNFADVTASGTHAGGLAAMLCDGAKIINCSNCGDISASTGVGGVAGVSDSGTDEISGCSNFGKVTSTGSGTYGTGGVIGRLAGKAEACANLGAVGGSDRYTGGVAGYTGSKNTSCVLGSVNKAAVSSSCSANTAAIGGIVGYAQYLKIGGCENSGEVKAGTGFKSSYIGGVTGRAENVTETAYTGVLPTPEVPKEPSFPGVFKTDCTVTFMADGKVVGTVKYKSGDTAVTAPAVPQKEGYTGAWDNYKLGNRDITVNAVYKPVLVRDGDTVTKNGTYHITWFSSGEIKIADGVKAVIDGSNGGSAGFDGLTITVGKNASITLKDAVLSGEKTLLSFAGGNTLTLEGENELISRADAESNAQPTVRVSGNLTINGSGSLYANAGIRNTAVFVEKAGSRVELKSGTLSVDKEDLLGFEGGAFMAESSELAISGGTFRGHTASDNVAVVYAEKVTLTGGRMLMQAENCPAVIRGSVNATGGTIAAYGHDGKSAATTKAYWGKAAIPGYSGSAAFEELLPFTDVFVTDRYYTAVETCYKNGYFKGTSDTAFSPDVSMNRAMFVTVLYRLAGQPKVEGNNPFKDVTGDWYKNAVTWAVGKGITNGTSETTFSPENPVTREQAAVFLCRYAQVMGDSLPQKNGYVSHGELSDWAEAEALWALSRGLFAGAGEAMAEPQSFAPRSLLAVAISNYAVFTK